MKRQPPGLLRASVNPDVIMMVCTAGHVDHGKTSLVKLLTGCNTDRLKVEQERGMTIELGFAPCFLGGDLCVGIVDVPGHERFVRNMVAGVSGIDMTILVIAADDGIMPQTIEHFQIMDLLGVRRGIVALTKVDLVTEGRVAEVTQDIQSYFIGTFLEGAPIYPVSSETGQGVFEFYEGLVERIRAVVKQRKRGIFRMPIERVFAQKGFGTVMTGIPVDGSVAVGMEVELVPGGQCGRVRGLQRFLRNADEGGYGQCLAINVPEFSKALPVRGQVLCAPGYLRPVRWCAISLKVVTGTGKSLANGENVKFHSGTAEQMAKLHLLDGKALSEGETGYGFVVFGHPVAVAVHDRFILRRPSPAATIAGGEVLAVSGETARVRKAELCEQLRAYHEAFQGVDPASPEGVDRDVEHLLRTQRPTGATTKDIVVALLLPEPEAAASLQRQTMLRSLAPDFYIHENAYAACLGEMRSRIQAATDRKDLSLDLSDLRKGLPPWPAPLWSAIQKDLEGDTSVSLKSGKVILRGTLDKLNEADRDLIERIRKIYEDTGFLSPRPDELPELLKAAEDRIEKLLRYLCNEGQLVRLAKNVVLGYNTFKKAQDIVVKTIQEKGVLDSADFKYLIGSSRKYALAILDFLDTRRVTVRADNNRKLAPNYERNLLP